MDHRDRLTVSVDDGSMGEGSSGAATPELLVVRDRPSERGMIKAYAAESIQDAYRRYKDCKPYVKQLKTAKYDKFVMNIAADTIKDNLKKFVKSKSKESVLSRSSSGSSLNKKALKIQVEDSMYDEDVEVCSSAQAKSPVSRPQSPVPLLDLSPVGGRKSNSWTYDEKQAFNVDEKLAGPKSSKEEPQEKGSGGASQRAEAKDARKESKRDRNAERKSPRPRTAPVPSEASSSNAKVGKSVGSGVNKAAKGAAIKAAVEADRKPHTTIRRSVPNLPAAKAWLVVDEAMALAMRRECSFIKLHPHEALKVLDALGYPLDVGVVQDIVRRSKDGRSRDERVEIPLSAAGPLAATLTAFGKSTGVASERKYFSVGEAAANVALKHICALVQGSWRKNRTWLLRAMCDSDANPRPSMWNGATVRGFIAALQLPPENFGIISDESIYNHFLYIEKGTLEESFRIAPTVLQARFSVYQHLLRLLDQWWDKGVRPDDAYLTRENRVNIAGSSEFRSMKDVSGDDCWGVFEGSDALELEGGGSSLDVQVAYSSLLLQSWVPLSRAYGWGVPIELLSALASAAGGLRGWINRRGLVAGRGTEQDELDRREDVKGCRWVRLDDAVQQRGEDDVPWPSLFRRHPALHSVAKLSGDGVGCVLAPLCALRPRSAKALAGVAEGELQAGQLVTIATEELLRRALERLDWWDRPLPDVVKMMAGRTAEVVSTAGLYTSKLVGVRIEEIGVTDALPLEALASIVAAEQEPQEGTGEPARARKAKAKRRKKAPRPLLTLVRKEALEASASGAPAEDAADLDSSAADPAAEQMPSFSAKVQRWGAPTRSKVLSDYATAPPLDEAAGAPAEASPPKRLLYRPCSAASSPSAEAKVDGDDKEEAAALRRDISDFNLALDHAPVTADVSAARHGVSQRQWSTVAAKRTSEGQSINIKLPLPSLEAVDYSWLKPPARLSPQVSPTMRLSVDNAAQTENDDDSNLMIQIPYGDYHCNDYQPTLNIITPIFDFENAEYGDGVNNGRFALLDRRVFDKDSLLHNKLEGRQKSPPYVRRIKQIASNKKPVFDDSFDPLPDRVVTGGFGVLGRALEGKRPPAEGGREAPPHPEDEHEEPPRIAVFIPEPPAAPEFKAKMSADRSDPIIEKIDYEAGAFGVEGRGVGKPFVQPPSISAEPKAQPRPRTAAGRVGQRLAGNLKMTDNLPDDVMGEGLHLGAATVTGLKPKARLRPQSASYHARARLLDNYKARAEIAGDIHDSIDKKEEGYKRLEELRSSKSIEHLEKFYEKEINDISKM